VSDSVAHELDGRRVLVTVGATGIGAAAVEAFGAHGATDDLDFLIATNLKATFFTNQAAFTAMRNHGGRIIDIGSSEAVTGSPIAATYVATKAAAHAWTRTVAKTWAYCGVTVNAVAPAVETPDAQRLREFLGPDGTTLLDQQLQSAIPRPSR